MKNILTKSLLTFIMITMVTFGVAVPTAPANALVVTDPGQAALQGAKWAWEKGWTATLDALLTAGKVALVNGVRRFLQRIAYDSAVYIGSGGQGQKPLLFTKDYDKYLEDAGKDAAGAAINSLGDKWGVNFCAPVQGPSFEVEIQTGFLRDLGIEEKPPPPLNCTLEQMEDNFDAFVDRYSDHETLLNDVGISFKPGNNDLGVVMKAYNQVLKEKSVKEDAARMAREIGESVKDKKTPVSKQIQTPAALQKEELKEQAPSKKVKQTEKEVASMNASESLSYILANTASVFLNTAASTMLNKLTREGFISVSDLLGLEGEGGTLASKTASQGYGGRAAAQLAFAELLTPQITTGNEFSLVNEFAACPSTFKSVNNCVMDQSFVLALSAANEGAPITIREALSKGWLRADWKLYPPSHELNSGFDCYSTGYCYSNLVKMRRARMIPVGFEIAAKLSPKENPWRLGDVVEGFNDCQGGGFQSDDFPFCHLIDPNWILKAPPLKCNARAFGQTLTTAGVNTREEICADVQDCVAVDDQGNCLGSWGYCMKEKNVWRLDADQCPAQFAGCQMYKPRVGQTQGYLSTTIDHSICDTTNVGCRGYLNTPIASDDGGKVEVSWATSPDQATALNDFAFEFDEKHSNKTFFNKEISQCSANNVGCTLVERIDNSELHLRIAPRSLGCYDYDGASPGVQLPVTVEQAQSLVDRPGCNAFSSVCAEEELGCREFNPVNDGRTVTGIVTASDLCPLSCVGYDTYKQEKTNFESSEFPLYLIPSTGNQCSFDNAGCDEFTNLDVTSAGGEGTEYYSFVRQCEKPGVTQQGNFYTWEGSDTVGYQLQVFDLASGHGGIPDLEFGLAGAEYTAELAKGAPRYNTLNKNILDGYMEECNIATYGADPDCREIYDADGNVYYRFLSKTITISDDCHPLRRTLVSKKAFIDQEKCTELKGLWSEPTELGDPFGNCEFQEIVFAIPSESTSCPAQAAGCRIYQGKGVSTQAKVLDHDFEGVLDLEDEYGWNGATVSLSSETLIVGGHAMSVEAGKQIKTDKFTPEAGSTYAISFWAKGSGTIDVGIQIPIGPGNLFSNSFTKDVDVTATKLTTTWKRYQFGPIRVSEAATITELDSYLYLQAKGAASDLFIDNIEVTQGDFVALIKNSWNTPVSCDSNPNDLVPGPALGCTLYKDDKGTERAIKSFTNLCRPEAIGCEDVVDTRNTETAGTLEYNTSSDDTLGTKNEDENDNILVGSDRDLRVVLNKSTVCPATSKGCSAFGFEKIENKEKVINTVYLLNTPDKYSGLLCVAEADGCDSFTSKTGIHYFKDPAATGKTCDWREGVEITTDDGDTVSAKGWFVTGATDPDTGETIDTPCADDFLKTGNEYGIWKSSDINYAGYAGQCNKEYDQCFELVDRTDLDSKGRAKQYFVIDNNKLDRASCNGNVSRQEGCVLFDDTRNPIKSYAANAAYAASESKFGAPVPASNYELDYEGLTIKEGPLTDLACSQDVVNTINTYSGKFLLSSEICKAVAPLGLTGALCDPVPGSSAFVLKPEFPTTLFTDSTTGYKALCDKQFFASNTILKVRRDRDCALWLSPNSFTTVENAPAGRQKQVTGLGVCESVTKKKTGIVQCAKWVDPIDDPFYGTILKADAYSKRGTTFTSTDISGIWPGEKRPPYQYKVVKTSDKQNTILGAAYSKAWLDKNGGDSCAGKSDGEDCGFATDTFKCLSGSCMASLDGNTFKKGKECRGFPEETSPFASKVVSDFSGVEPVSFTRQEYTSSNICQDGNDCACAYTKRTYGNKTRTLYYDIDEQDAARGVCIGGFFGINSPSDVKDSLKDKSKTGYPCGFFYSEGYESCLDDRDTQYYDANGKIVGEDLPQRQDGICQFEDPLVQNYRGWEGYCIEPDLRITVVDSQSQFACNSWYPLDTTIGVLDIYNQFESAGYQIASTGGGRYWCAQAKGNMSIIKNGSFDFENQQTTSGANNAFTHLSAGFKVRVHQFGSSTFDDIGSDQWFKAVDESTKIPELKGYIRNNFDYRVGAAIATSPDVSISALPINKNELDGIQIEVTSIHHADGTSQPPVGTVFFVGPEVDQYRCYHGDVPAYKSNCEDYEKNWDVKPHTIKKINGHGYGVTRIFENPDGSEDWVLLWADKQTAIKQGIAWTAYQSKTAGKGNKSGNPFNLSQNGLFVVNSYARCDALGVDDDKSDQSLSALQIHFNKDGTAGLVRSVICDDSEESNGANIWELDVRFAFRDMCLDVADIADSSNNLDTAAFTQRLWSKRDGAESLVFYDRDGNGPVYKVAGQKNLTYGESHKPYGSLEATTINNKSGRVFTFAQDKKAFDDEKLVSSYKPAGGSDGDKLSDTKEETRGYALSCTGGSCGEYQYNSNVHSKSGKNVGITNSLVKLFGRVYDRLTLKKSSSGAYGYESDLDTTYDVRKDEGKPPVIASLDESALGSGGVFKLRTLNAFNVNTKEEGLVFGIGNLSANMRFAAWADTDQMPLKRVFVDWTDGSGLVGGGSAKFKNKKPYCGSVSEAVKYCSGGNNRPNITCESDSDCLEGGSCASTALVLGNDGDGCSEGFFEYQHVYAYSENCGVSASELGTFADSKYPKHVVVTTPMLAGETYGSLKKLGVRPGDPICIFKPKVQVKDNWGWCNGDCRDGKNGESGCLDAPEDPFIGGECKSTNSDAWTPFVGEIIVVADEE